MFSPAVQTDNQIKNLPEQIFNQREIPHFGGYDKESASNLSSNDSLLTGKEGAKSPTESAVGVESFLPDVVPKPGVNAFVANDSRWLPQQPVSRESKLSEFCDI